MNMIFLAKIAMLALSVLLALLQVDAQIAAALRPW